MFKTIRFFATQSVSRRVFLLTLTSSVALITGCGSGNESGNTTNEPTPVPNPTPSPIVLPQGYTLSYNVPSSNISQRIDLTTSGDVLTTQSLLNDESRNSAGIFLYTNQGRPELSQRIVVRPTPGSAPSFAVSSMNEVCVLYHSFDLSPGRADRITALSLSGELLRSVRLELQSDEIPTALTFGASGDMYISDKTGIRKYTSEGVFKNLVIGARLDENGFYDILTRPAILSGDVVCAATFDGFELANADGSNRRSIPARIPHNRGIPTVTRADGEGNLYVNAVLPADYPNVVYYGPDHANNKPFIIKFAPDGTQLAAILTQNTLTINDFDVDQAGNVYVASEEQVSVYGRVR